MSVLFWLQITLATKFLGFIFWVYVESFKKLTLLKLVYFTLVYMEVKLDLLKNQKKCNSNT